MAETFLSQAKRPGRRPGSSKIRMTTPTYRRRKIPQ